MTKKKTLMVVSDAVTAPTGFGRVAEAILDRLYEKGWNIKQMGINYFDEDHDKPYRIFSANTPGGLMSPDWVGYDRIGKLYEEIKPDALFLFQDFWHIAEYIARLPDVTGLVTYFPVDSPNIKYTWALPQALATDVCTYTQFGAKEFAESMMQVTEEIKQSALEQGKHKVKLVNIQTKSDTVDVSVHRMMELTDPSNIRVIPHGLEASHFYPIDKRFARDQLSLPQDLFLVGNVNRNQPRKRLDLTIKAFAEFAKDKKDVALLFHDPAPAPEGWDLAQLAQYYGVKDKVMLSNSRYETGVLNNLYNSLDVMVNSSGGEGWGLTPFESARCRVPQIVPDWSATKEIWEGIGLLTKVISVKHEMGRINTAQCVIDDQDLADQLQFLYDNPEERVAIGEACYQKTLSEEYDWDKIADTFHEIFLKAIEEGRPEIKEVSLR